MDMEKNTVLFVCFITSCIYMKKKTKNIATHSFFSL